MLAVLTFSRLSHRCLYVLFVHRLFISRLIMTLCLELPHAGRTSGLRLQGRVHCVELVNLCN